MKDFFSAVVITVWRTHKETKQGYGSGWYLFDAVKTTASWMQIGHPALRRPL